MRARTNKSGNIVFTLTPREAARLGVSKVVFPGVTFTPEAPEVKEQFECLGELGVKLCYKAGHKFSRTGAFGGVVNGKPAQGHNDLNPSHTMAKV